MRKNLWICHYALEKDSAGGFFADDEYKRVVCVEVHRFLWRWCCRVTHHFNYCDGGSFGAPFRHVDPGFLDDFADPIVVRHRLRLEHHIELCFSFLERLLHTKIH